MLLKKFFGLPIIAWIIAFLFFIKAIILALWIVPLWDIPDESGHFAYSRDIASGSGVLPLTEAEIDEDIMSHVKQYPVSTQKNWIVQHPPLYHIVAGTVWRCATFFTNDSEWLFRAPRLTSALFGALTLLFIFKIIYAFQLSNRVGLAVMIGFSSIPMFSWLSSGTSHDTLVAFLGCVSAYYFVCFLHDKKKINAYISVFIMSLAAATKMTALVTLAPLVGFIVLEFECGLKQWINSSLTLLATALIVPGIWLIRNFIEYGDFFATAAKLMPNFRFQDNPLTIPFIEYLNTKPVIEHFFVHFFGLIGWMGTGQGNLTWFQIRSPFLTVYIVIITSISLLALIWVLTVIINLHNKADRNLYFPMSLIDRFHSYIGGPLSFNIMVFFGVVSLFVLIMSHQIVSMNIAQWLIIPIFAILFVLFILSLLVFVLPIEKRKRSIFYALFVLAFFSLILLWQVYHLFLLDGRVRATHGRYFYPALGMIVIGLVVPALLMLGKLAERVALPTAAVILCTEASFYFVKVLPFISGESIR